MYFQEKLVMFEAVLGPLPTPMVMKLKRDFPGIVRWSDNEIPAVAGCISRRVENFVGETELLSVSSYFCYLL